MKTLDEYFRSTAAVQHFVNITKREDGKPIVATISPYGIPGETFEIKVDMPEDEKPAPKERKAEDK
jgi:hypothetical protein